MSDGKSNKRNRRSRSNGKGEDADVQLSKALSWVLRHSGPSLGLRMSPDGYVPLAEILECNHPRFAVADESRGEKSSSEAHPKGANEGRFSRRRPRYTTEDVVRVVETNNKQRFRLERKDACDLPARKNQRGAKNQRRKQERHAVVQMDFEGGGEVSVAGPVITSDSAVSSIGDDSPHSASNAIGHEENEVDHTSTRDDETSREEEDQKEEQVNDRFRVLCIRANQGHSLRDVGRRIDPDSLLVPLSPRELADPGGTIVHGTSRAAWENFIRRGGLKRMRRTHIHFASGLPSDATGVHAALSLDGHDGGRGGEERVEKETDPETKRGDRKNDDESGVRQRGGKAVKTKSTGAVISGMRSTSQVYIYVDGKKCARDAVPFHRSDNEVILTSGVDGSGTLPVDYIKKVVDAKSGDVLWTGLASAGDGKNEKEKSDDKELEKETGKG